MKKNYFLTIGGISVIVLLSFVFWYFQNRNSEDTGTQTNLNSNSVFSFISQESIPDHPVFVSEKYHFNYTPTGNYTYFQSKPDNSALLSVGIFTQQKPENPKGINLSIYANTNSITTSDVSAFRKWRKDNIYDNVNDPITEVVVSGSTYLKATQADGIDSSSDYYYFVTSDYIYVFFFSTNTPIESVSSNLSPFKVT